MHHRTQLSSVLLACAALAACGGGETERRADTQAAAPAAEEAPPPPPAANSKIGKLALFTTPFPGDSCVVRDVPAAQQGTSGIVKNISYEGASPQRSVRVAIGDASRTFRPISLEISARQAGVGGPDETEALWVLFAPSGDVRSGTRQFSTSDNSAAERAGLLPSDSAAAKQLATTLIDVCRVRL